MNRELPTHGNTSPKVYPLFEDIRREVVLQRLSDFNGNKFQAAKSLGINRNTFNSWLKKARGN